MEQKQDINPRLYLNHLMPKFAPHGADYCQSMIGVNTPRSDGPAKASGTMTYASDVIIPDMMYGVCLRSPYPHAEIVSMVTGSPDVAVVISGCHSCMTARGIQKPGTKTITTTYRGRFASDEMLKARMEALLK